MPVNLNYAGSRHGRSFPTRVPRNGQPSELVNYSGRVQLGRDVEATIGVCHGIRSFGSVRLDGVDSYPRLPHSHRAYYIHHRPDQGDAL